MRERISISDTIRDLPDDDLAKIILESADAATAKKLVPQIGATLVGESRATIALVLAAVVLGFEDNPDQRQIFLGMVCEVFDALNRRARPDA